MTFPPQAAPRTNGKAIAALVLGICGIVVFPLFGIAAIFVGSAARNEIARDPSLGGEGLATAGIVLGWISVALIAIGILILVVFLAAV